MDLSTINGIDALLFVAVLIFAGLWVGAMRVNAALQSALNAERTFAQTWERRWRRDYAERSSSGEYPADLRHP